VLAISSVTDISLSNGNACSPIPPATPARTCAGTTFLGLAEPESAWAESRIREPQSFHDFIPPDVRNLAFGVSPQSFDILLDADGHRVVTILRGSVAAGLSLLIGVGCRPASSGGRDTTGQVMLPTGRMLDPVGHVIDVGNMPLTIALAPDRRHAVLLLSGWRERGLQVVDLAARRVTQTLPQPGAFLGVAFSTDGKSIFTSGAARDVIYRYAWDGSAAKLTDSISISAGATSRKTERFPAGIAISSDGRELYVAENLSDSLAVLDIASRNVIQRLRTGRYPSAIVVAPNGDVYVSAWGDNFVTAFRRGDSGRLTESGRIAAGRHPSALLLNSSGTRLFVASSSTDRVFVVDTKTRLVTGELSDAAPAGPSEGSTPNALLLSTDESRLFVAEADNNSVAVFELSEKETGKATPYGAARLAGRIPTLWYPTALAEFGGNLVVVSGKGRGTHANPDGPKPGLRTDERTYVLGQLNGALTLVPMSVVASELSGLTTRVSRANGWASVPGGSAYPPFEHVVLIIKENRTYDQVFGDMPGGDGDSSLLFFPRTMSPNHRALAVRFGVYDRFFVNAEVSSQGHPWSVSAYVTEYTEKTVHTAYADLRPGSDEAEAEQPVTGYLWDAALRKGLDVRNYGEYAEPEPSPPGSSAPSGRPVRYRATRSSLAPVTNADYPSFDMSISDQRRADIWLAEFAEHVRRGRMPALEIMHLPRDHTAGSQVGACTPQACFADNDLALGRIIEAISRSPFWKNTVVFVIEDDAQDGPDHVDSHRSVMFTISPYNRAGTVHRFVNTTDVLSTIEGILHLEHLSQFDHFGRPLQGMWSATADLTPYSAITPSHPLDEVNRPKATGYRESARLNLASADRNDDESFNRLLWRVIKGDAVAYPGRRRGSMLDYARDR
jgi:YVTN family beta-propeller protein